MATFTECNRIITLGYLDAFINGLVQSSDDGHILSVNYRGRPASYCPTYSELTGGSFIQVSFLNASPSLDDDGIYVTGTYAENQNVRQIDLGVKYTRYKELVIGANPTSNISACETAVTLSYVLTYTRYDKKTDAATTCTTTITTSSDVADDYASVFWSHSPSIGLIAYPTFTIYKNPTYSERTTNVNATTVFRRTTNTSNTVMLTQNGLGGAWETYDVSATTPTYSNFELTVYEFTCAGGTAIGSIKQSIDYYNLQRWRDSCGDIDPSSSRTVYDRTDVATLPWTDNIESADCTDSRYVHDGEYYKHYFPELSGVTADHEIEQRCTCSSCTCDLFSLDGTKIVWDSNSKATSSMTYTTNDCVRVMGVSSNNSWFVPELDTVNKRIKVTPAGYNTTTNDENATITVTIMADSTICPLTFAVTQLSISCNCGALAIGGSYITWLADEYGEKYLRYVSEVCVDNVNSSCDNNHFTTIVNQGDKVIYVSAQDINSGLTDISGTVTVSYDSTEQSGCTQTFTVNHKGKVCTCDALSLRKDTLSWDDDSIAIQSVRYNADNCVSNLSASANNNHFSASVDSSYVYVCPISANTSKYDINGIVEVMYKSGSESCSKEIEVTHLKASCGCGDLVLGTDPEPFEFDKYGQANRKGVGYSAGDCIEITNVSVDNTSAFTVSNPDIIEKKIYVWPNSANTSESAYSGVVTVEYTAKGNPCTPAKTFTVIQNNSDIEPCTCYTVNTITTPVVVDGQTSGTSSVTWTYTEYIHDKSGGVTPTNSSTTHTFNYTINSSCTQTSSEEAYTWTGHKKCNASHECTDDDVEIKYALQKTAGCCCDTALQFKETGGLTWPSGNETAKIKEYVVNKCVKANGVSVEIIGSGASHFNVSGAVTNDHVYINPIGTNDSENAIVASAKVKYDFVDGRSCNKEFQLTHNGSVHQACTCYTINTLTAKSVTEVTCEGGTPKVVWEAVEHRYDAQGTETGTTTLSGDTNITITANETCSPVIWSGNTIWADHKECKTGVNCEDLENDCKIYYEFEQPACCCCESISAAPSSLTFSYSAHTGNEVLDVVIDKGECISEITTAFTSGATAFSASNYVETVANKKGKISICTRQDNDDPDNPIGGILKITWKAYGDTCSQYKNIILKQLKSDINCSCDNYNLSGCCDCDDIVIEEITP